ncbi:hypothetical protein F5148DRAFT_1175618 [Russula earlei]|uniref:Uncharacterized protein n=1 Tax=Russula earlei TaxID=71964 RepID=A0ACC0UHR7_9AGAM|nr:hypothetical protein F5148DRAFT_1175618 [Russula earlei]
MNGDHLEQLVLSGKLFQNPSRSSSPARSDSSGSNGSGGASDKPWSRQVDGKGGTHAQQVDSIGMGPGRTGVKGVIRDRNEAAAREHSRKAEELAELAARMERANMGGMTFLEERNERVGLERRERGRFGHLREVGLKGFVPAVEEDRNVWVVVHIYDTSLERCDAINELLSRLARDHPDTKFIRCRASVIGFALNPNAKPKNSRLPSSTYLSKSRTSPRFAEPDEDDPYGSDTDEPTVPDMLSEEEEEEEDVDTDMLPTVLVYHSGQLVHNWVRVDWEAGLLGIDELLKRHNIIHSTRNEGPLSVPLNDDDDLVFSAPQHEF